MVQALQALAPLLGSPHVEYVSPGIQSKPLFFQFMSVKFVPQLPAVHCCEERGSIFSVTSP